MPGVYRDGAAAARRSGAGRRPSEGDGEQHEDGEDPGGGVRARGHARRLPERPAGASFGPPMLRCRMASRPGSALLQPTAFRLALGAGLLVTALHLLDGVLLGELPVVSRLEHAAQDWALTSLRGPRSASGDVVIVAIDERSIAAEGRWPWSRATMARLVDRLAEGGVRAAGFDVVWSDEDEAGRRLAKVASLVRAARTGARDPAAARRLDEVWAAAAGAEPDLAADVDPAVRLADAVERARNV